MDQWSDTMPLCMAYTLPNLLKKTPKESIAPLFCKQTPKSHDLTKQRRMEAIQRGILSDHLS